MREGKEIELHTSRAETGSGESRPFSMREIEDAKFILDVTALNGAPTSASLSVDIYNFDPLTQREQLIHEFTDVIQTTTLPFTEWAYTLSQTARKMANFIKLKWTITFAGGTAPNWVFAVISHIK